MTTQLHLNRIFTLLAALFCYLLPLFAQPESYREYVHSNAIQHVKLAHKLGLYYVSEDIDSLRILGENLFFYGLDHGYQPAIEKGKILLGEYFIQSGKISQGMELLKPMLSVAEEQEDPELKIQLYKTITLGYCLAHDANSALTWSKRIRQFQKAQKDPLLRIGGDLLYAQALQLSGKKTEAIAVYHRYISEAEKIKFYRGIASAYAKLGDIYRLNKDLEQAEKYFQLSNAAAQKTGLIVPQANAINNLAIIHFEQDQKEKALEYFQKALDLRLKSHNNRGICESYFNIGEFYHYSEKYPSALEWYQKCLQFAEKEQLLTDQKDALQAIANCYKEQKDYQSAILIQERMIHVQNLIEARNNADNDELLKLEREIWNDEQKTNRPQTRPKQPRNQLIWILGGGFLTVSATLLLFIIKRKRN